MRCGLLQYEAALAVDSVEILYRALHRVAAKNQIEFRRSFRNGKVYNNGTDGADGIDCDAEPVVPWIHGKELIDALREVSQYTYPTSVYCLISPITLKSKKSLEEKVILRYSRAFKNWNRINLFPHGIS